MSQFYDQASLVMVPSGYKDGKLYSQKPLSTSGELSFSRGSDIEATRVNANGYIQKAVVNYMLYSQDFTNAQWVAFLSTKTTGQTDPNGGTTAVKIDSTAVANSGLYVLDTTNFGSNRIRTASIWMKGAVGGEVVQMGDATNRVSVTLTTDWVRYEAYAIDASAYFVLYSNSAAQTWYAAFAQYEDGLVAKEYQPTTSAVVVSGITDNMPRLNYDPANPTCPSLLLEPSRQNILANDTYIAGTFAFDNCTASYNNSISPEGVQNALLLTQTGSTATNSIYNFSLPTTAGDYAYSFFVKAGASTKCRIYTHDSVLGILEDFNPQTITAGKTGGDLDLNFEDYGNDWWRVSFTRSIASGATYHRFWFYPDRNNTNGNVSLYGFQIESGSYSSSLIPTYGSSATRTSDACSKTGISSLIGQTEGTIFLEFDNRLMTSYPNEYIFRIIGSDSDQIWLRKESGGAYFTARLITNSSTVIWTISSIPVPDGNTKIAISYKTGDSVLYLNGTQFGTSSATFSGTDFSDFYFNFSGTTNPELKLNQALIFKTRLSNADLATLTTL